VFSGCGRFLLCVLMCLRVFVDLQVACLCVFVVLILWVFLRYFSVVWCVLRVILGVFQDFRGVWGWYNTGFWWFCVVYVQGCNRFLRCVFVTLRILGNLRDLLLLGVFLAHFGCF